MEESGCRICCGRERFHTGIWPQARHSANPDKENLYLQLEDMHLQSGDELFCLSRCLD